MTLVRARYYPAHVRLPDRRELRKTYVLLSEGDERPGLLVYGRPDEVVDGAGVDWARQPALPTRHSVARNGVEVRLVGGDTVMISPGVPCRCGALGRWAGPGWATTVAARA